MPASRSNSYLTSLQYVSIPSKPSYYNKARDFLSVTENFPLNEPQNNPLQTTSRGIRHNFLVVLGLPALRLSPSSDRSDAPSISNRSLAFAFCPNDRFQSFSSAFLVRELKELPNQANGNVAYILRFDSDGQAISEAKLSYILQRPRILSLSLASIIGGLC